MNKYSETVITITSHKADDMIIALWDGAYSEAMEHLLPQYASLEGLTTIICTALNAFEDRLRAELGVISRVPEGEESCLL